MIWGIFPPLKTFRRVWEKSVYVVYMFDRIFQSSHLILDFCLQQLIFFFLITNSISLLVISLFISFISSWFSFGGLYVSETCPFLLDCLICWHIKVHSIPLFFFKISAISIVTSPLSFLILFIWPSLSTLLGETGQKFVDFVCPSKNQVLVLMIFLRFL